MDREGSEQPPAGCLPRTARGWRCTAGTRPRSGRSSRVEQLDPDQGQRRRRGLRAQAAAGRGHPGQRQRAARPHADGTRPDRRVPLDGLPDSCGKRQAPLRGRGRGEGSATRGYATCRLRGRPYPHLRACKTASRRVGSPLLWSPHSDDARGSLRGRRARRAALPRRRPRPMAGHARSEPAGRDARHAALSWPDAPRRGRSRYQHRLDGRPGLWSLRPPEYGAAKGGLIRFTSSLADLRERMNVRVNCAAPARGGRRWRGRVRPRRGPHRPGDDDVARRARSPTRSRASRIAEALQQNRKRPRFRSHLGAS